MQLKKKNKISQMFFGHGFNTKKFLRQQPLIRRSIGIAYFFHDQRNLTEEIIYKTRYLQWTTVTKPVVINSSDPLPEH